MRQNSPNLRPLPHNRLRHPHPASFLHNYSLPGHRFPNVRQPPPSHPQSPNSNRFPQSNMSNRFGPPNTSNNYFPPPGHILPMRNPNIPLCPPPTLKPWNNNQPIKPTQKHPNVTNSTIPNKNPYPSPDKPCQNPDSTGFYKPPSDILSPEPKSFDQMAITNKAEPYAPNVSENKFLAKNIPPNLRNRPFNINSNFPLHNKTSNHLNQGDSPEKNEDMSNYLCMDYKNSKDLTLNDNSSSLNKPQEFNLISSSINTELILDDGTKIPNLPVYKTLLGTEYFYIISKKNSLNNYLKGNYFQCFLIPLIL